MIEQNKIFFFDSKRLFLASIFCFIFSLTAFSQGEREKNLPEAPRVSDHTNQFDNAESAAKDNRSDNYSPNQSRSEISTSTNSAVKKDSQLYKLGGEKDIKKEGMSTLSFNLFLYIVDKFKED